MNEKDQQYEELIKTAKDDPNIIGLFLGGSRGKGFHDDKSDYDIYLIVKDSAGQEYKEKYPKHKYEEIDLMVYSESEFAQHAQWQGDTQWNRYNFAYNKAIIDKNNSIQNLLNSKGEIPVEKQNEYVSKQIDAYVNHLIRAVRSYEKKDDIGFRLSSTYFIYHVLGAFFGLERRINPYGDYLAKELRARPLKYLSIETEQLLMTIGNILKGEITIMQGLAKKAETVFREQGYEQIFNDWNGRDKWAINFNENEGSGFQSKVE